MGHRVLCIADSLAQAEDFQHIQKNYKDVELRYPGKIDKDKASFRSLIDDCREVIKEEDVDAIITLHPANTLIHAALMKDFPKLRGPSFEAALMCLNKYYNKQRILHGCSFKFVSVEVEDATAADYASSLEETGEQGHLVDAIGTNESLSCKLKSDNHLSLKEVASIKKSVMKNFDKFRELLVDNVVKEKHPMVFEPLCIVGEFWQAYDKVTFHQVECCVPEDADEGEMIPWAITDLVYSNTGDRRCLKYVSLPSLIKENTQMNIWAYLRTVCGRLCNYGFKQHFFNAIVVSSAMGDVKIVDLNCGIIKDNTALYRYVLNQGDNLRGLIDVNVGEKEVRRPKILQNRYAMRAELRTFLEEGTVEKCIDLKLAKVKDEVELFVQHNDQALKPDLVEGGMKLANLYLTGANRQECLDRLNVICCEIVKHGAKMNWKVDRTSMDTQQEQAK